MKNITNSQLIANVSAKVNALPDLNVDQREVVRERHATCFLVGAYLVGKKHYPELTEDEVESSVGERQLLCVHRLKRNMFGGQRVRCELKHRGIDDRGYDVSLRSRKTNPRS